jgi:hypothetical protein
MDHGVTFNVRGGGLLSNFGMLKLRYIVDYYPLSILMLWCYYCSCFIKLNEFTEPTRVLIESSRVRV